MGWNYENTSHCLTQTLQSPHHRSKSVNFDQTGPIFSKDSFFENHAYEISWENLFDKVICRASGIDRKVKSLKMNFLESQFSEITVLDHGSRRHQAIPKNKFSRAILNHGLSQFVSRLESKIYPENPKFLWKIFLKHSELIVLVCFGPGIIFDLFT